MEKMRTQMEIVRDIVENAGRDGIRTEQIKIAAMYEGVSCADRFGRWLCEAGEVVGMKKKGDKTKTFWMKKFAPLEVLEFVKKDTLF